MFISILKETNKLEKIYFYLISALVILFHQYLFQYYLSSGYFHYDWQSALSRLIFGKIWFLNNGLAVPWFTPHICCGLPFFANPQSEFYSLTQILFNILQPLTFIKILFLIYSVISYFGFFILSKKIFSLSNNSSIIGSSLFLFNHYFIFHYLSGHIAWSVFCLIPILFYLNCLSYDHRENLRKSLFYLVSSSLVFSLMMHTGGSRIIVEILLSIYFLTLIHIIKFKDFKIIIYIFFASLIGLCISSSKVYSAWVFVSNFPRDLDPIQFRSFFDFIKVFFDFFFLFPKNEISNHVFLGSNSLSIEELSFNISVLPLIILSIFVSNFRKLPTNKVQISTIVLLLISMLIIILLGFSNSFLGNIVQKLPIITNDWVVFRMYAPFVIIFCLTSSFMFEKINLKPKKIFTVFFVAIIITQNAFLDERKLNTILNYSLENLLNYNVNSQNFQKYEINKIISILDENLTYESPKQHDFFLENKSIQFCYFSIFGYDLKQFIPIAKDLVFNSKVTMKTKNMKRTKDLKKIVNVLEGDPYYSIDESLNFINPACYLNPEENNCKKNYFFKEKNKSELIKFLKYKPYKFKHSNKQVFFNYLSLIVFLICMFYALYWILNSIIKKTPIIFK